MPDWLIGFIVGVALALLGFLLTVTWEVRKLRRESQDREKAVMGAVKEELLSNVEILKNNQTLLNRELAVIDEGKTLVVPLNQLQVGFWDLVKVNLPQKVFAEPDFLAEVREISQLTDQVNETVRSRESYRIHNGAMSNYLSRMAKYDQLLLDNNQKLLTALEAVQPRL